MRKQSTVPNARYPASACCARPHVVQHPSDLGRGEIGIESSPVLAVTSARGRRLSARGTCRRFAVLPDEGAAVMGRPVRRSQTMQVSRWLVMPMAAMSSVPAARGNGLAGGLYGGAQMSSGSCSTQPEAG